MTRPPSTPGPSTAGPSTVARTAPAAALVLAVAAWLAGGWLLLYPDLGYAPASGVVAGVVLTGLALVQLREPSRGLWQVLAWAGVVVAVLPEAFRFGAGGREVQAYVNHAACGLLVLLAAVWAARRTPREQW